MKKFLIGFLAAILVCTLAVGALAATGKLSIEVNTDMKIRVNGEVFAPTDANGNPTMVFEYNGTTYAPLRALAEAYGLEVGYDAKARMATVDEAVPSVEPSAEPSDDYSDWDAEKEAAYQEFKAMWDVESVTIYPSGMGKGNGERSGNCESNILLRALGETPVAECREAIENAREMGMGERLAHEIYYDVYGVDGMATIQFFNYGYLSSIIITK